MGWSRRIVYAVGCVSCALALAGCGVAADDGYYDVRAVVTTGGNGTDGDVSLCYTVGGSEQCRGLSSDGNDFEAGATNRFDLSLSPHVAKGTKFTGIHLKYGTGLSFGDTWEPTHLRVSLFSGHGDEEVVCDAALGGSVSNGDTVTPPGCP